MQPRELYDKAVAAGLPMGRVQLLGGTLFATTDGEMPTFRPDDDAVTMLLKGLTASPRARESSLADVCVAVIEGLAAEYDRVEVVHQREFAGEETAWAVEINDRHAEPPIHSLTAFGPTLPDALAAACDILATRQPAK